MKVTIESGEPLGDVLRAISRRYDVTLTTADGRSSINAAPRASTRRPPTTPTTPDLRHRVRATARVRVDLKLLRQCAWVNGHEVSRRGSLLIAVRAAFEEENVRRVDVALEVLDSRRG